FRYDVDVDKFPVIKRISDTLSEIPAFKRSHPNNQPDAEEH
ncbi:hypothetical protein AB6A40_011597, partial [Gnathostoma spinigerum]